MTAPAVMRAERFLMRCEKPVLMGDICEAIGLKRTSSARIRQLLTEHLGDRLIAHVCQGRTGECTRYSLKKIKRKKPEPSGKFPTPKDLFRGWYNPATGITGERLG